MNNWIETDTGNRISRLAAINGAQLISLSDNCTICEDCILNGDVVTSTPKEPAILLGKYCFLSNGVKIDPPILKTTNYQKIHSSVTIGNYTTIGEATKVSLAQIGNRVHIGSECVLGALSTINDCCVIEPKTVIPPKLVIPPYSRVSGTPGKDFQVEVLGAGYRKLLDADARTRHVLG